MTTTFDELSAKIFEEIIVLVEKCDSCIDYEYVGDRIDVHTNGGVLLINKKTDLMELWVSSTITGSVRFSMRENDSRFVNKGGEEIVSWVGKFLSGDF